MTQEATNGAFPSSLRTPDIDKEMSFPENSVPGNQSPLADKNFTDRWGNWWTGAGLDLGLETEVSAIL